MSLLIRRGTGGDKPILWWVSASVLAACSLLWSSAVRAETFKLSYGKRFELCRAYQKNLDAFPDLTLMAPEWPLDPALKEFRKPRWRTVDSRKNLPLIKTMYLWHRDRLGRLSPETAEARWQEDEAPFVMTLIEKGLVRLDVADLDFDADGKAERVYRYYHPLSLGPHADAHSNFEYWYIYFHDYSNDPYPGFRIYSDRAYDSFLYRGRFYLVGLELGGLGILEPKSYGGNELAIIDVCIYQPQTRSR